MSSLQQHMNIYRHQLQQGSIQKAYLGLMEYMLGLRTYLNKKHPEFIISSNIYFGYMDMTYFAFTPPSLQQRKLKIAIVFLHEEFRFEVWLSGVNRKVQTEYYQIFKKNAWDKYRLIEQGKDVDSILESIVVEPPDFDDLDELTAQIEAETLNFIGDIESFFSEE